MSRPSRNTDLKLIQAAKQLIMEKATSQISMREIAKKAGVNLGMFAYHFKGKEDFLSTVMQALYEDFLENLKVQAREGETSIDRLTQALKYFGKFSRDNRTLLLVLMKELLAGHPDTIAFALKNFPRHLLITRDLILECQRNGYLNRLPMPVLAPFMFGSIALPHIFLGAMENATARLRLGPVIPGIMSLFASDSFLDTRVELILKALAPDRPRKRTVAGNRKPRNRKPKKSGRSS